MNSLCLCEEKEADNGEKIFKDFNNFINMKTILFIEAESLLIRLSIKYLSCAIKTQQHNY